MSRPDPLDPRIADAIQTIGSIAEHDPIALDALAEALGLLGKMCQLRSLSRGERLAGQIELAVENERRFDLLYARLPEEARW
jgi:hypothetical protein